MSDKTTGRLNFRARFSRDAGEMVADIEEANILTVDPEISEELYFADIEKQFKVLFLSNF